MPPSKKKPATTQQDPEALKRSVAFVPCKTQKDLKNWLRVFLDLELPDSLVDAESNCTPFQMVWECYSKMLANDDPDFNRVLYYSSRDSGKCVEKGTLLLTEAGGLKPIEEVQVGDTIWSGWGWRKVVDWIHEGEKEAVTVKTSTGYRLTTSKVHRVWAWRPGEQPGWTKVSELRPGVDVVAIDTNPTFPENDNSLDSEEWNRGYLCGILQGDGCLSLMDKHGCVILTASDEVVREAWFSACQKYAGRDPKNKPLTKRKYDYRLNSVGFIELLKSWGLKNCYSWEKEIPAICLNNRSALAGFLSGLFDTDGGFEKGGIVFSMTAEKLLRQCLEALTSMGVYARFRSNSRIRGLQKHLVHHLLIPATELPKLQRAGFTARAKKAGKPNEDLGNRKNCHDGIPRSQALAFLEGLPVTGGRFEKGEFKKPKYDRKYPTISRQKFTEIRNWATRRGALNTEQIKNWGDAEGRHWAEVVSVKDGTADFYDLTVEEDHSYWSAGFISHNTLAESVIEVLCLVHLERDVIHLASIEAQSLKAQEYVKGFLSKPVLRDYIVGNNQREVVVLRYRHKVTGANINKATFEALEETAKSYYETIRNYARIVVATLRSTNGQHASVLALDEIDIMDPLPYEEAKMIPTQGKGGKRALTILTSTRKFNFGLVQPEIEKAQQTGLHVRHWNVLDITEACPPSRHRPDEPKVTLYHSRDLLRHVKESEYEVLSPDVKEKFEKFENSYAGCESCKIFSSCKTRLVTEQKTERSERTFVKEINHTIGLFRSLSVSTARAQLLCWRPSSEGLIYPYLERETHMLTAEQMAEKITGEPHAPGLSKSALIQIMRDHGMKFVAGMDFGFTHDFAFQAGATDGFRLFVIECTSQQELDPAQKVDVCKLQLKKLDPDIWADTAAPEMVKFLKKAGFRMRKWVKGEVLDGIEIMRMMIRPGAGEPRIFYLKNDEGCEIALKKMSHYHWKVESDGRIGKDPDQTDDDSADAGRYLVHNVFAPKGILKEPLTAQTAQQQAHEEAAWARREQEKAWFRKLLQEHGAQTEDDTGLSGGQGSFKFTM